MSTLALRILPFFLPLILTMPPTHGAKKAPHHPPKKSNKMELEEKEDSQQKTSSNAKKASILTLFTHTFKERIIPRMSKNPCTLLCHPYLAIILKNKKSTPLNFKASLLIFNFCTQKFVYEPLLPQAQNAPLSLFSTAHKKNKCHLFIGTYYGELQCYQFAIVNKSPILTWEATQQIKYGGPVNALTPGIVPFTCLAAFTCSNYLNRQKIQQYLEAAQKNYNTACANKKETSIQILQQQINTLQAWLQKEKISTNFIYNIYDPKKKSFTFLYRCFHKKSTLIQSNLQLVNAYTIIYQTNKGTIIHNVKKKTSMKITNNLFNPYGFYRLKAQNQLIEYNKVGDMYKVNIDTFNMIKIKRLRQIDFHMFPVKDNMFVAGYLERVDAKIYQALELLSIEDDKICTLAKGTSMCEKIGTVHQTLQIMPFVFITLLGPNKLIMSKVNFPKK